MNRYEFNFYCPTLLSIIGTNIYIFIQDTKSPFPTLSLPHNEIKPLYDVIVIGSGYGASIAASRCARAGQKVCVLERGKEWQPGDFPESLLDSRKHFQLKYKGKKDVIGTFLVVCVCVLNFCLQWCSPCQLIYGNFPPGNFIWKPLLLIFHYYGSTQDISI